jgi:hypothetical protein
VRCRPYQGAPGIYKEFNYSFAPQYLQNLAAACSIGQSVRQRKQEQKKKVSKIKDKIEQQFSFWR